MLRKTLSILLTGTLLATVLPAPFAVASPVRAPLPGLAFLQTQAIPAVALNFRTPRTLNALLCAQAVYLVAHALHAPQMATALGLAKGLKVMAMVFFGQPRRPLHISNNETSGLAVPAHLINVNKLLSELVEELDPSHQRLSLDTQKEIWLSTRLGYENTKGILEDLIENALDEQKVGFIGIRLYRGDQGQIIFSVTNQGAIAEEILRHRIQEAVIHHKFWHTPSGYSLREMERNAERRQVALEEAAQLPVEELPFIDALSRGKSAADFGGAGEALHSIRVDAQQEGWTVFLRQSIVNEQHFVTVFLQWPENPRPRRNHEKGVFLFPDWLVRIIDVAVNAESSRNETNHRQRHLQLIAEQQQRLGIAPYGSRRNRPSSEVLGTAA